MADGKDAGTSALGWMVRVSVLVLAIYIAYTIRLYAIINYGPYIHEFDPWFNFRATEYLKQHGMERFFKWFDHMSWYPLGRPVGTTIYPGMQITAVWIHDMLQAVGMPMSLNDVCCYVPAWFGAIASVFLGLLTAECSSSTNAGVAATLVMSMIPAHIMRSVGGKFDNECIAMSAMCSTWWLWCRALRTKSSWPWGLLAGISYVYMVAAWGGYIFVLNMVGLHAALLYAKRWLWGEDTTALHRAYSLFYVVGTAGAVQIPVVGWTPLKSLEQLGACAVFLAMQILEVCGEVCRRRDWTGSKRIQFHVQIMGGLVLLLAVSSEFLMSTGYFQPLGARIRGLFVKHTRTGNPLVDSVAEHQPTTASAYYTHLNVMCYVAPIGFVLSLYRTSAAGSFLVLYAVVAYYFSSKMNRLVLLMGPITSALAGVAFAAAYDWSCRQMSEALENDTLEVERAAPTEEAKDAGKKRVKGKAKEVKGKHDRKREPIDISDPYGAVDKVVESCTGPGTRYAKERLARASFGLLTIVCMAFLMFNFHAVCDSHAEAVSQPSIMWKAQLRDGSQVIVRDYLDSYLWLKDNTEEDARVMAWWDYGYQITGIGNRTTIADGNTWNHEHIATLGRCLTSPERKAHKIIRHLADYVLVWCQGGGDLGKSPHMARIGNSVYEDICPGDPTCRKYGFEHDGGPTPMMAASLLYKLHNHGRQIGSGVVAANETLWKEVYQSKYGLVRIFKVKHVSKESKIWAADPANRNCDAPGSWYCPGNYPPALQDMLAKRKAFSQLEDFNSQRNMDAESRRKHEEYQREYHRRMRGEA
eukprot:TRINITY_DN2158_c0_g3_i1.p1 TRINITY_DN2158_c0_g3~~TRINITY_DN2158_c0_g3_i1.p1  ORF type:complete len:810 (+),score=243.61 TRINITY_DN2158_c0_g3_i1:71-2500(+)